MILHCMYGIGRGDSGKKLGDSLLSINIKCFKFGRSVGQELKLPHLLLKKPQCYFFSLTHPCRLIGGL